MKERRKGRRKEGLEKEGIKERRNSRVVKREHGTKEGKEGREE